MDKGEPTQPTRTKGDRKCYFTPGRVTSSKLNRTGATIRRAVGHGHQPWPSAMDVDHGLLSWPSALVFGLGCGPWLSAMAVGHGLPSWPLVMTNGKGASPECVYGSREWFIRMAFV